MAEEDVGGTITLSVNPDEVARFSNAGIWTVHSSLMGESISVLDIYHPRTGIPQKRQLKWDLRFLGLAYHVAQWSKDPSTKVGAVIVRGLNRVVSIGYNGFASGVDDTSERYNDRELKYKMVVHGEINAIIHAKQDLAGCTLYTWPLFTCSVCAGSVIQSGIHRVVSPVSTVERWASSYDLSKKMYDEAGVSYEMIKMLTVSDINKE